MKWECTKKNALKRGESRRYDNKVKNIETCFFILHCQEKIELDATDTRGEALSSDSEDELEGKIRVQAHA